MKIGALTVDPPLILAPMAGVTDSPFRRIVRSLGGCGLVSMEFLSSEALTRGIAAELDKVPFAEEERPLSIQIYGSRPAAMAEAARLVERWGAEVCDINMGCPARKILRGGAGAALMGDLDLARRIIAAVRRAISIPLTVKFRSGLDDRRTADLELGRICQGEGVDAVTLHPRTARQQYAGAARWERIRALKQALDLPVVGNGDVTCAEDARRMFDETGCDAVMIGRAALTNPWIFRQAADQLIDGSSREVGLDEHAALVRRHFDLLAEAFDERGLLHKLKTFTGRYSRGLRGGRSLRCRLSEIDDPQRLRAEVEEFFSQRLAAQEKPYTGGGAGPGSCRDH